MTNVSVQNLSKSFGNFKAVDDVSIDIPDGSFVCLLGPSGCGKTTLLRLIAGLEALTSGDLLIDGVTQNDIPAHKRNFGMVFQSLALFPHLSVAENIAYPLKIRGADKQTQRERVSELLELVKLPDVEHRRVHQLSGGQRQRVAIARGLAISPKLFLLDEPLSALDAKLREHMQIELRLLQKQLDITTIVVTHDQREAMTMADIVIIMDKGKILQSGSPIEIYRKPVNGFVADFIGMSNLLPCEIVSDTEVKVFDQSIFLTEKIDSELSKDSNAILSARPEDLTIVSAEDAHDIKAEVSFIRDLGSSIEILFRVQDCELLAVCSPRNRPEIAIGQQVAIKFNSDLLTVMSS
jgi:putative spermidine/putrescine transport system ATP-binding protein